MGEAHVLGGYIKITSLLTAPGRVSHIGLAMPIQGAGLLPGSAPWATEELARMAAAWAVRPPLSARRVVHPHRAPRLQPGRSLTAARRHHGCAAAGAGHPAGGGAGHSAVHVAQGAPPFPIRLDPIRSDPTRSTRIWRHACGGGHSWRAFRGWRPILSPASICQVSPSMGPRIRRRRLPNVPPTQCCPTADVHAPRRSWSAWPRTARSAAWRAAASASCCSPRRRPPCCGRRVPRHWPPRPGPAGRAYTPQPQPCPGHAAAVACAQGHPGLMLRPPASASPPGAMTPPRRATPVHGGDRGRGARQRLCRVRR